MAELVKGPKDMFDLDQAIMRWRRQMAASGVKVPQVLDELESHVRDAVERQVRFGESEPVAFEAAIQELGPPRPLKVEFAKLRYRSWLPLTRLSVAGLGLYLIFAALVLFTNDLPGAELWLGLAALAVTLLTCLGVGIGARRAQHWGAGRTLIGVVSAVVGVGWLTSFLVWILPRLELSFSQFLVALLWTLAPVIAGAAFALGLEAPRPRRGIVGAAWALCLLVGLFLTGCISQETAARSPKGKLLQDAERYVSEQRAQDRLPGWRSTEHGRVITSAPWPGAKVTYPASVTVRAWKDADDSTYWYRLQKDAPEAAWRLVEGTRLDKDNKVVEQLLPN